MGSFFCGSGKFFFAEVGSFSVEVGSGAKTSVVIWQQKQ